MTATASSTSVVVPDREIASTRVVRAAGRELGRRERVRLAEPGGPPGAPRTPRRRRATCRSRRRPRARRGGAGGRRSRAGPPARHTAGWLATSCSIALISSDFMPKTIRYQRASCSFRRYTGRDAAGGPVRGDRRAAVRGRLGRGRRPGRRARRVGRHRPAGPRAHGGAAPARPHPRRRGRPRRPLRAAAALPKRPPPGAEGPDRACGGRARPGRLGDRHDGRDDDHRGGARAGRPRAAHGRDQLAQHRVGAGRPAEPEAGRDGRRRPAPSPTSWSARSPRARSRA